MAGRVQAVKDLLLDKPTLFQDEVAQFIFDEFDIEISTRSVSNYLRRMKWTRKNCQRVAAQRSQVARNDYWGKISSAGFRADQLVFVDESGCDKRIGTRKYGWAPQGIRPVEVTKLARDKRWNILPAYTLDGYIAHWIYQGGTTQRLFNSFIEEAVLPLCNAWPGKDSVIIMDNASCHKDPILEEMCNQKGVKLIYLPPYSPDLNPIEESFAELKAYVKRHWDTFNSEYAEDFSGFLAHYIDEVGLHPAHGHFRSSGYTY